MLRTMAVVLFISGCGATPAPGGAGGGMAAAGGTGGSAGGGTGGGMSSGFAGDACDNQRTVALTAQGASLVGTATSDNSLASPSVTPSCAQRSRDVVFKLELPRAGSLRLTATPHGGGGSNAHFDPVISVFGGASCAAGVERACGDSGAIDAVETLNVQVQQGTVWVWISSADPMETGGEFDLAVRLD